MKALLFVLIPLLSFAGTPSNEIPTNELIAGFSMVQKPNEMNAILSAALIRVYITEGRLNVEEVDLSNNDVITFAAGDKTIRYDAVNPDNNILPYVGGVQYNMHFERFNGEIFKSMTTAPMLATFSTPENGQVFEKTDTVYVAWNYDPAATASIVFYESTCATLDSNKITFNESYTKATIEAGAAETCDAGTNLKFWIVNYKEGTGYGEFNSYSFNGIGFYYGKPSAVAMKAPSRAQMLKNILLAKKNHLRVMKLSR